MKQYKAKHSGEVVRALQWDGGLDRQKMKVLIDRLVETETEGGIKFREDDGTHDLVIRRPEELIVAHPGWWVCEVVETGEWDTIANDGFVEIYEEVV